MAWFRDRGLRVPAASVSGRYEADDIMQFA